MARRRLKLDAQERVEVNRLKARYDAVTARVRGPRVKALLDRRYAQLMTRRAEHFQAQRGLARTPVSIDPKTGDLIVDDAPRPRLR